MRRWSRGTLVALIVAIATASGFLNEPRSAASLTGLELAVSLMPLAVEVRSDDLVFELKI